jgi:hypothetical protein
MIIDRTKFPDGFGEKSRQFWLSQYDRALGLVRKAEQGIPASMWQDLPPEVLPKYVVMLREARLSIAKQGLYDKTTMNIMKRARCSVNPADAECATQREIE